MKTFVLCGRGRCCPYVELPDKPGDFYTIKDDFGGSIQLTADQMRLLKDLVIN